MRRREFLAAALSPALSLGAAGPPLHLTDVTGPSGIRFRHNSGAYGRKFLPETLGPGCAFIDYDNDGWQDILLVNGMDWPGRHTRRDTLALYRNNRNGTFTDVTRAAGLDVEMYGLGVAVADFNNDGFQDIYLTGFGQNRLFRNTGKGAFMDVTQASGLGARQALSTSALWFDYDRDGLLDLFVCNYVKWTPGLDVYCSMDGKQKSYCTPEAYHGATCWLFRNQGNGTFEDVTAQSGLFDNSSKSLGVAMFDYDHDGWPDLFVANDTQPNKLYRNLRNGRFEEIAVRAGVAFSEDGKARAGMGVDAADADNSGRTTLAVTNFDNEMLAFYRAAPGGIFQDEAMRTNLGGLTRNSLGFGCCFFDADLDGRLDLLVANGHIDDTVRNLGGKRYAQSPQLFLQAGDGRFHDVAAAVAGGFVDAKVGRGAAVGDFDNDGDLDILLTTNNGPAYLYRNDLANGNRSIRFRLVGTKSNRDGIGAVVKIEAGGVTQTRMVRSGSSYLSQSELPVTFGIGQRDRVDRVVVEWPSGKTEDFRNVAAGRLWVSTEGKGLH
jgi:enediyne biosynthesis protein E4